MEDVGEVKEQYAKMMELHQNMESKLKELTEEKQDVEEKFKALYDEHENLKTR